jgi:predicted metal-dependent hydrolase
MPPAAPQHINIDGIHIAVTYKRMKTITLRVRTPSADVVVSAPLRTPMPILTTFIQQKLPWIRAHQQRIIQRAATQTPELGDDGSVRIWGQRTPVTVTVAARRTIRLSDDAIFMTLPEGESDSTRHALVDGLYRRLVSAALPALVAHWSPIMQVTVHKTFVQKMKTRWGSCNYRAHHIRLNSELASYPPQCLEYVVVHELVHLLEASHNARFYALMTQFYPDWKEVRALLRTGVAVD